MPKVPNYEKAVIYKIQNQERPELIYVGSTTDFTRRKALHKQACNNSNDTNHNLKLYKMIRENEGWDAFKIMIIKEFPCVSKVELLIEEDRMMIELKASLNCKKAHNTHEEKKEQKKQYRDVNKEKIKKYQQANQEKRNAQQRERRQANKANELIV